LKKELKKQIKEDEFLSGIEVVWKWFRENEKLARSGLLATALVVAVVAGLSFFNGQRERGAAAAFDAAMRIYETPVAAELQGAPPSGVSPFKEASEKFTKAAAAFDGVERAYPGRAEGRRARYFAALCRIELGDSAGARKALEALAASGGLEASLAKLSLADIDRRAGAVDKAVEAYKALAEDAAFALPRDYVLMTLAGTLEEARRTQEAAASYQSLYERYPDSSYAAEAQQRAAYLRGGGQG
jgi:tetratricopeptide (TPR) repeat protein